ncbi:MAG TPA: metal-dependent hydrolase [Thermoanaerobaculia bacterium]|nr:metal-dependent hydrolase [Thermoanaerobaculia bacterium]
MASILSHPAVPLAIGIAAGPRAVPPALTAAACAASILPDVDSIGFWLGVPYDSPLGHRGFTHSLCFAALVALGCALLSPRLGAPAATVFAVVFVSTASHGVLDALTTGGMGVAFLSPFSNARFFLPWRVIAVSPIGLAPFLSARGARVLRSELGWIWAPAALIALAGLALRRLGRAG